MFVISWSLFISHVLIVSNGHKIKFIAWQYMLYCKLHATFRIWYWWQNTGQHRSTQIITGQLCIFNNNWHSICRVVTYGEVNPPMNSNNSLSKWPRDVAWQVMNRIFPLPHDLLTPILAGWWLKVRVTYPRSHMIH